MTYYDYSQRHQHSNATNHWGSIFGLKADDLTFEQLNKLNMDKLLEFLPNNSVENIIINRMVNKKFSIEELNYLRYPLNRDKNFKNNYPRLVKAYNDFIYQARQEEAAGTEKVGSMELFRELVDERNYYNELIRSMKFDDNYSLVNIRNASLDWIKKIYNNEIYSYWKASLDKKQKQGYLGSDQVERFFRVINKDQAESYTEELKKLEDKKLYHYSLASQHLNRQDTHDILKEIRKSSYHITVNAKIDESMLLRYATVTRLEVMERLMHHAQHDVFPFPKELDETLLSQVLFGSSIKYNNRFGKVIAIYKHRYDDAYTKGEANGQ